MDKYPSNYTKALHYVLSLEGGPTNHQWDPGGETAYGISKRYWPNYWVGGVPTFELAQQFYYYEFWVPLNCPSIECVPVATELFEAGVNCGIGTAGCFLQKAYNLIRPDGWADLLVDGAVGPKTIAAVNRVTHKYQDALLAACNYYQADHYARMPRLVKKEAIRGWFARRLVWTPK